MEIFQTIFDWNLKLISVDVLFVAVVSDGACSNSLLAVGLRKIMIFKVQRTFGYSAVQRSAWVEIDFVAQTGELCSVVVYFEVHALMREYVSNIHLWIIVIQITMCLSFSFSLPGFRINSNVFIFIS